MTKFNLSWDIGKMKFNHSKYLPKDTIRMLIVGSSGCGKSFLLMSMLLEPGFLDYNYLHVCTPNIQQLEYSCF